MLVCTGGGGGGGGGGSSLSSHSGHAYAGTLPPSGEGYLTW